MIATNNNATQAAMDIRDIKPPMQIADAWIWMAWGLVIVVLLAFLCLAWIYWRKRRLNAPIVPLIPAHLRARQKLEEALALIAQPKPFCIAVSDTVRFYL